METKIISTTETEAQFSVIVSAEQLAHAKKSVYDELRPRVKASGFRPGKAPDMIVEREMGSAYVQSEVMEHAVQDSYSDAIQEHKLPVVAQPEVSLEKFVPYTELEYKVKVELMPAVKLPDYKAYRIKRPSIKVEPAEIDEMIADLRKREAVTIDVDRPAAKGDEVNFDFAGTKDGVAVDGATAEGHTLTLGSNSFIPGFEEEMIGLSVGDEKTFDIRFPKDYHEKSLADQVVTFAIKINSLSEQALPELDQKFIEKVGPFKSVDALREDLANTITTRKAESNSRDYEQSILDKLIKDTELKTPESLVRQQLGRLRSELEQNLSYSGLDYAKYLELSKKTEDDLEKEMRPEAEKRVALAMILTEVSKAENVAVTNDELDDEIARMKQQYPDPQTQAELDNARTREEIYNHLMASRVIAKLVGYAESK